MKQLPQGSLISFMSTMVKEKGGINMAQGLPGFEPPKELIEILKSIANNSIHQYPPGIGNFKILDLLQAKYSKVKSFKRENFLVTQGATEAICLIFFYLMKNIKEKFSVMAFNPAYESYKNLPLQFGYNFIEADLNEEGGFNEQEIENQIINNNVKIFFTCSPGNPYGKILPKLAYEKLIEICRRNNCYLVIDAVYREIYFEEEPYIPVEKIGEFVFYVNSFSKLLSITGWRVGYMIAEEKHMSEIRRMHDYTGLCANSVMQEAIAIYLESYNMGLDYVSGFRPIFKNNFKIISDLLIEKGFKIPKTDGGYFVWTKLPEPNMDGFEIALDLYNKTQLATVPGIHFSPKASNYIRFNIARPEADIEAAVEAIKKYF